MTLLAGIAFALLSATPAHADSITERDIKAAYLAAVHVEMNSYGRGTSIAIRVAPPSDGLLSAFLAEHEDWFTYLVKHGRRFRIRVLDDPAPTFGRSGFAAATVSLDRDFHKQLSADTQFNAVVVPGIAAYLRQHGIPVSLAVRPPARRRVSIDTAMTVAVRFFDPDVITEDNHILTHVCVELNAVRELPSRDVALEALIFSAINRDQNSKVTRVEEDYAPARRVMRELDIVRAPKEVRLRRAQGVMWASMRGSQVLRTLLREEAERSHEIVPIELFTP